MDTLSPFSELQYRCDAAAFSHYGFSHMGDANTGIRQVATGQNPVFVVRYFADARTFELVDQYQRPPVVLLSDADPEVICTYLEALRVLNREGPHE